MKKFLLVLACAMLTVALSACGGGKDDETEKETAGSGIETGAQTEGKSESSTDWMGDEDNDINVSFDDLFN